MSHRTTRVTRIESNLRCCRSVPHSNGACRAIELLEKIGAQLYWGTTPLSVLKPITEADGVLSEDGSIIVGVDLHHRALRGTHQVKGQPTQSGVASFGFFAEDSGVSLSQGADFVDSPATDELINGLLMMSSQMYSAFLPCYGWVDESGWNLPDVKALQAKLPKYLFWSNFFGPEYVKAIGRDFLLKAPGWSIVDLDDGGMLYVATESYRHWWENDQDEILAYFKKKMPKIQIYRAQPIPY